MKPIESLTDTELLQLAREARSMRDAPESAIQAAIALFPTVAAPGLLRRLLAVLESDSARTPALASGLRSSATSTRQLFFSVEGCDIDLRVASDSNGHAISGQVLGPEEGGRVELLSTEGELLAEGALDGLGEFRLAPVRAAACRVVLHLPAVVIELPAIDLQ